MNSFEPELNETEQKQQEQSESPVDSQTVPPGSVSETKQKQSDERPAPDSRIGRELEADVSAQQYLAEVSYSCLLIPRFDDHYLAGDITEYLVEWMREVCISYGWRLEAIVVRPGYFQWVMTVPLNVNPAQALRLTRQHTSQKIFDEFPRYKRKNMSGDFWAPGHFVAPGKQLLSLESIHSFTLATRKQQGFF